MLLEESYKIRRPLKVRVRCLLPLSRTDSESTIRVGGSYTGSICSEEATVLAQISDWGCPLQRAIVRRSTL